MTALKQTPGTFTYCDTDSAIVTIVLDAVVGTAYNAESLLYVYALSNVQYQIEGASDIKDFNDALAKHIASKVFPIISTESFTAEAMPGATCITGPGVEAEHVGNQVHAEGRTLDDLTKLMHALAASQATIKTQEEPVRVQAGFMKMLWRYDYCKPLREAAEKGYEAAAAGKRLVLSSSLTVHEFMERAGHDRYHQQRVEKGDLGSTYLPANKSILLKHIDHWNQCMQSGLLVAFAPGDSIRVVKQGEIVLDNARYNELVNAQMNHDKLLRVINQVRDAAALINNVVTPKS